VLNKEHGHAHRLFFVDNDRAVAIVTPRLAIYDLKTGVDSGPAYFPAYAISADGKMMASFNKLQVKDVEKKRLEFYPFALYIYSREKDKIIGSFPVPDNYPTPHVLFSPDGRFLFAAAPRGSVRMWDLSNLKP
jgi:WD40 repeat protein